MKPVATLLIALAAAGLMYLLGLLTWVAYQQLKRQYTRWLERPRIFKVKSRTDFSDQLIEIRLAPCSSGQLQSYWPGQHITVVGPLLLSGRHAERRYSLASWTANPSEYVLCIKVEGNGLVSNWLKHHAVVNHKLKCRLPVGDFEMGVGSLDSPCTVLIAAGVGVTPVKAMAEWLLAEGYTGQVYFHHSAKDEPSLLYADYFRELDRLHGQFHYYPRLTRVNELLRSSRLSGERLFRDGGLKAHYWMCASTAMTENITEQLSDLGVPPTHVHSERFNSGAAVCGNYVVAYKDRQINSEGFASLLQPLEVMGASVQSDCRAGTCGRCKIRVITGRAKHTIKHQCVLKDCEYLACCTQPESNVVVETVQ